MNNNSGNKLSMWKDYAEAVNLSNCSAENMLVLFGVFTYISNTRVKIGKQKQLKGTAMHPLT